MEVVYKTESFVIRARGWLSQQSMWPLISGSQVWAARWMQRLLKKLKKRTEIIVVTEVGINSSLYCGLPRPSWETVRFVPFSLKITVVTMVLAFAFYRSECFPAFLSLLCVSRRSWEGRKWIWCVLTFPSRRGVAEAFLSLPHKAYDAACRSCRSWGLLKCCPIWALGQLPVNK